jgi:hypothetical protein
LRPRDTRLHQAHVTEESVASLNLMAGNTVLAGFLEGIILV